MPADLSTEALRAEVEAALQRRRVPACRSLVSQAQAGIEGEGSTHYVAKPFFAYMLECSDSTYYTGHTDNLEARLAQHQAGIRCVYTASRRPVRLVWCQEFVTRDEAKVAEAMIKGWSRAKKKALISGDFDTISRLARKLDWEGYHRRNP